LKKGKRNQVLYLKRVGQQEKRRGTQRSLKKNQHEPEKSCTKTCAVRKVKRVRRPRTYKNKPAGKIHKYDGTKAVKQRGGSLCWEKSENGQEKKASRMRAGECYLRGGTPNRGEKMERIIVSEDNLRSPKKKGVETWMSRRGGGEKKIRRRKTPENFANEGGSHTPEDKGGKKKSGSSHHFIKTSVPEVHKRRRLKKKEKNGGVNRLTRKLGLERKARRLGK